jgi:RNA polymerase sigma factor (TIGR02999 family)
VEAVPSKVVTEFLVAWGNGDKDALNELIPLVYARLHRMAAWHMRRERPGHTLQTSALVNEAYCRLVDQRKAVWQNRAQFFCLASHLMRRILVNHAKKRARLKRGGAAQKISLDETAIMPERRGAALIMLDDALTRLANVDPQMSRIVEMKFFGGLSMEEIASVEKVSTKTIQREWLKAKAWLYDAIRQ